MITLPVTQLRHGIREQKSAHREQELGNDGNDLGAKERFKLKRQYGVPPADMNISCVVAFYTLLLQCNLFMAGYRSKTLEDKAP